MGLRGLERSQPLSQVASKLGCVYKGNNVFLPKNWPWEQGKRKIQEGAGFVLNTLFSFILDTYTRKAEKKHDLLWKNIILTSRPLVNGVGTPPHLSNPFNLFYERLSRVWWWFGVENVCFNVLSSAFIENMKKPYVILIGTFNTFEAPLNIDPWAWNFQGTIF